jgi:UDP-galactopyranose mutase
LILGNVSFKLNTEYTPDFKDIADKIIYTGPIDQYFNYCYGKLNWRSLDFRVSHYYKLPDYQGCSVMNYADNNVNYTRSVEYKHFIPFKNFAKDKTIVVREYPCDNEKEPYYPVNTEDDIKLLSKYQELAEKEENVHFGGRLAEYKYYNMDEVVKKALTDYKKFL